MLTFYLLFLLFFGVLALDENNAITIPLERHFVSKEVLKARQSARLAKLGIEKGSLPKYHQRLLESTFKTDYFTLNISLGTPKQNFQVLVSTGINFYQKNILINELADVRLWIIDNEYPAKSSNQHVYNPLSSSTAIYLNKDFNQIDGFFSVDGTYYSDVLQIGRMKVQSQAFGSIQKISNKNDDGFLFPVDGIIGLNHLIDALYKNGSEFTAPIDNLLKNIEKVMAIYLEPFTPPKNGSSQIGQITFVGLDDKKCNRDNLQTSLTLFPFQIDNRFVFNITSVYYYNYGDLSGRAIGYADSGISTIIMPLNAIKTFLVFIIANYDWDLGIYTYPCSNRNSLNYFSISTSSGYFYIYPNNYLLDIGLDNGQCALALEINDGTYKEDFVFGMPLFREYCVLYDFDNNQIRFYGHKNN